VTLDNPQALAAAENYVIVLDAGEVKAYDTAKWKAKKVKLPKGEVEDMFLRGKELALYVQGDELTLETQTLSYVTPVVAAEPLPEPNKAPAKAEPEQEEEDTEEEAQEETQEEVKKEEPKQEEKKSTVDTTGWKTLRRGMKGKNVRTVQQRLRKLGYPVGEVDGDYGSKTIRAMRFFQAIAGLEITGLTDAETYAALMEKDAPKYDGRGKVESSSKKDDDETTDAGDNETTAPDTEGGDGEGIGQGGESEGAEGGSTEGSGSTGGSGSAEGTGEGAGSSSEDASPDVTPDNE